MTYTPSGALTTGGSGAITYSSTILTTGASIGSLTLDTATGGFNFAPADSWNGNYQFTLKADSGTCHAEQTVTVAVQNPAVCAAPTLSTSSITAVLNTAYSGTSAASGGITPYTYTLVTPPIHGTVTGLNATTGAYTYTSTAGYTGADSFALNVASSCGANPGASASATATMSSNSVAGVYGASGTIAANGAIIIDNTPNPGTAGIVTNMGTNVGGKNFGVNNSFSIDGIQVMQRDVTFSPHRLVDEAGVTNAASTSYNNYGTTKQTTYFANGQHLFDLDRLRRAANWMRVPSGTIGVTASATIPDATTGNAANLMSASIPVNQIATTAAASCTGQGLRTAGMGTPIGTPIGSCHPLGTYGVITWREFLDNIRLARTMYGVVRILVPLQVKSTAGSENNALNATVLSTTIYGFCTGATEWCADSPTSSTNIKGGAAVAGHTTAVITMPAVSTTGAQLRVRGTLMFDFVNGTTDTILGAPGHPVPLANLPFDPCAIYFKVSVPIT